jgi:hypothetical protein
LQCDATASVYFELEVLELEAQRSQTMAIGFTLSLPTARPLLIERATDLGQGSFLVGYDLPKLYVHGDAAAKICAREWRPLKELSCGDRVGLLASRSASNGLELTVYVNGSRKVCVPVPGVDGSKSPAVTLPWPGMDGSSDVWGVVDVHGAVRSVRLKKSPNGPLPSNNVARQFVAPSRPLSANSPPPTQGSLSAECLQGPSRGIVRTLEGGAAAARPDKRPRLPVFAGCGSFVHLISEGGGVTHVKNTDFCIGRDTKVVNLALESEEVPNMVSRKHARIVSNDGGVHVIDCRSLNGTWLNGKKVDHHLLSAGDQLVIGNPNQSPAQFRFTIAMPSG